MTKFGCLVKKGAGGYATVPGKLFEIISILVTPHGRDGMIARCTVFSYLCIIISYLSFEIITGVHNFVGFAVMLIGSIILSVCMMPIYSAYYDCYIEGEANGN